MSENQILNENEEVVVNNNEESDGSSELITQTDPQQEMKEQYIKYMEEIKTNRFSVESREQTIENLNTLCNLLKLTTVIPKTETRSYKGQDGKPQQQQIIVGGTPIDLIKSQYPGVYPILVERMLELAVKL